MLRIWGAPAVVNSPQFAFMSKTIREGKLGVVASAHGQYGHTGPTWAAFFYEKLGGSITVVSDNDSRIMVAFSFFNGLRAA